MNEKEKDMILCKIINKTNTPLALNWVPGGISIPVGKAAVLEYDPFTLMNRTGSIYNSALAILNAGLVEVQYCPVPPAVAISDINAKAAEEASTVNKPEPPKQRDSVFSTVDGSEGELDLEVGVSKIKPVVKHDIENLEVSVPKDAPKAEEPAGEQPAEAATAVAEAPAAEEAPKTTSKKRGSTKKI